MRKNNIVKSLVVSSLLVVSAFADSNIDMPEPDYTDFYAGAGVVLGISVVVMLAKRLKSFFR
jgi:hypothetical protein